MIRSPHGSGSPQSADIEMLVSSDSVIYAVFMAWSEEDDYFRQNGRRVEGRRAATMLAATVKKAVCGSKHRTSSLIWPQAIETVYMVVVLDSRGGGESG